VKKFRALELCAGAGGQALGLEKAGFEHIALIDNDASACGTLRQNRHDWNVIEEDIRLYNPIEYVGKVDLFAAGVPCPPFSVAGKQLGADDDRDLFPEVVRYVKILEPRAIMLENVKGLMENRFSDYRVDFSKKIEQLGYIVFWNILHAADYGLAQLRPRAIMVALLPEDAPKFVWPIQTCVRSTVGNVLGDLMGSAGWPGTERWIEGAQSVGPTIVGGSKKHGGADLGPTRAKAQWKALGVDGLGIANLPPDKDFPVGAHPKLTLRMVARLQGFPDDWAFYGKKTGVYRQIGNAFPPPVAQSVAESIKATFGVARPLNKTRQLSLDLHCSI
jgi:DNA (cytosine-5)-methyltransferase 1